MGLPEGNRWIPRPSNSPAERLDLHNASVDQTAASAQMCGQLHLRSGRVCILAVHHTGSCHFVSREEMVRKTVPDRPSPADPPKRVRALPSELPS